MQATLTTGPVWRTLVKMAVPMLAGTFAMNAYNLTDTWFVAQLGTLPLAAMGFTFPVIMLLSCLAGGLGTGVTVLVSHAIGQGDREQARRLTVHGFLLVFSVTALITLAGILWIEPVFQLLGADEQTLPLIRQFMEIWFAGSIFMTLPMVGNGLLLSCGDSRSAARLMMLGTLLNTVLDPIFIFGYLGVPAMGIRGAALATLLAQAVAAIWLCYKLNRKHGLLVFQTPVFADFGHSLRAICRMGVPSIFSMIMMPISSSVMTRIISSFGTDAVAATGAAGRIEMFAFVIPMALGMSLSPYVSQNLGAGADDRIRQAVKLACGFAVGYGGFIALMFYAFAPQMAALFADEPTVRETLVLYIRTISFGYGLMEVHRYCGIVLTGLHKPMVSMTLNAIRVFVLLIPFSLIGVWVGTIQAVFEARLLTDLMAGSLGFCVVIWYGLRTLPSYKRTSSPLEEELEACRVALDSERRFSDPD